MFQIVFIIVDRVISLFSNTCKHYFLLISDNEFWEGNFYDSAVQYFMQPVNIP